MTSGKAHPTGTVLRVAAALLIVTAAPAPWAADGLEPTSVAFENVTVIDGVAGVRDDQRVVVTDDRIASVTPMSVAAEPVSRTVDGAGRFLIPGLWDMHVHFLYEEALTDAMAELFLDHGVTSVRDTGGSMERLTALRTRLESSAAPAPRVFVAGPLLDGRFVVYDGGDPERPKLGTSVSTPAAAEPRVAALKSAGADFIKIYELVTPETFRALVAAARQHELPVAAHVPLTMTADQAGPMVDSMEHLRNVELACAGDWADLLAARRARIAAFEDGRGYDLRSELHERQRVPAIEAYDEARCVEVLRSLRDTVQVPTLRLNSLELARPWQRADWDQALARLPDGVAAAWRLEAAERQHSDADTTFAEWSLFLTGLMRAHGVPIGAGTDTPISLAVPGYSLHTELALLVESGLTPLEALTSATIVPARFFELDDRMGSVEAGKVADLVLLDANPLDDIDNTRRIAGVMLGGRWMPQKAGQTAGAQVSPARRIPARDPMR